MADNVTEILLRARGDFSDLTGKISGLRKEFQNLKLPKDITENLEKSFNRLDPVLKSYQKQLNKGFKTKTDLKNFEAMRSELDAVFGDITSEIQKVNGQPIQLKADLKEITALEKKLDTLEKQLQTKLDNITIDKSGKVAKDINTLISVADKATSIKPMTSKAQSLFDAQDFVAFNAELDKIQNKILGLSNKSGAKIDLARSLGFKGELFDKEGNIITAQLTKVDTLIKKFFSGLKVSDSSLTGLEKTNRDISQTGEALSQIKTDSLTRGAQAISALGIDAAQASKGAKELSQSILDAGSSTVRMADELSQLQSSTQYFFSLRNMINLFKRGVREAVDTVKELDAAMTETAVVTNYSVSDMWEKLPEYTANAKALGSTIQQMYEATTLYYQQGLNDTQAMGIANETMKMARIGGLEAADATDKMTAALRGFNMEINEISAQRVNDVYSNLAAKTASNTEELGTAMQRTASIAASAGMSFEGTAAFLAQAIETTREPAENLGTAMKTIVARFTELKKNPLEISEVDGEEVDYNKVDAALKSIGVSLKDTNGQFRALDEVFLDISQRWDSLTQTQQRYVATQAAGSRQQSRFIAMMSNYNRTLELMDYANNSAGASTEQFNKTMDSLEAKLNIFKDTWQEFLMGIANEEVIKKTISGANLALTTLNKIINAISKATGPVSGLTKSVLSLGTAFFGLRSFGRLANGMIRGFGGMLNPSTSFGEQFKLGILNSRNSLQAAAISNPIVNAIRELHPLINKAANHPGNQAGSGNLKGAQQALAEELYGSKVTLLNGSSKVHRSPNYTPQALLDIIGANGLTPTQQKQLFDRNPGLKKNLKKSLSNLLEEVGTDKKTKEGLVKGLTSGKMPLEDILKSPELRKTWGEQYQDILNKYGQDAWAKGGEGRQAINDLKLRAGAASVKDFQKGGALYGASGDEYKNSVQSWLSSTQEFSKQEQVMQKIANNAQKISGGMMAAGAAFSMVGSIVGESNEELGKTLTTIGMITTAIGSLGMAFSTFMNMNPILMGISLAIGAAIGAVTVFQKHVEGIKKAGQEVVDTYKEINSTTEENISTLKSYYEQVEHWSKGVDEFGNNVNLSDEEYAAYRDAVNKIAEINPGIVEGYNAQGKAIIDINKALKETIKLETQRQKKAQEEYTNIGSLDKLIRARNANKDYRSAYAVDRMTLSHLSGNVQWTALDNWLDDHIFQPFMNTDIGYSINKSLLKSDYLKISKTNKNFGVSLGPFETILDNFNANKDKWWNADFFEKNGFDINFEALSDATNKGHARAVRQFIELQDQIYAAASAEGELNESTVKSFDNLKEQSESYKASFQEVLTNLQTFASSLPGYADLSSEMRQALSTGLEEIAADPELTAKQMQKQTAALVSELDKLTGAGTAYSYIMEDVAKHQEQFANDLNEAAYFDNIKDDLEDLDTLMKRYENDTTAYGRAVYEFLTNQKAAIKDFTSSGETFLADAINEMTGVIAEAEGAYTSFQEATKTDYSTGKSSMKSIYDELFAETDGIQLHLQGSGDKTLWKGAETLLGREFIEANNYKDVVNALKNLGPYLKEGQEGFDNFWNAFMQIDPDKIDGLKIDKEKGTYDIEDSKAEEVYKAIAKEMKMSESFLMSMLNAGQQYASINFTNDEKVRKALATDESVIRGKNGTLFTTNDYLNSALSEGGIVVPEKQQQWKEEHQDKVNLVTIDNLDELSQANLEQMGITDMRSAIEVLGKTGLFQSDQIEEVAKRFADYNAEDYEGAWQQYLDREADPTLAPIESIEANVASIASSVARNDVAQGKITQADLDKAADFREKIKGGAGIDTATQYFGQGLDEYGTVLTSDQYKKGKANLEEGLEYANQWKEAFQEAADNVTDPKKQKQYQQAADNYAAAAETIQNNLNAVDKNYAEAYANYQKELTTQRYMADGKTLSEAEKAAEEVYHKAFTDATEFIKSGGVGDLDETVYTKEEAQKPQTEGSENNVNTKDLEAKRKELEQVFNLLTTGPWADGFQGLDLNAIVQSEDKIAALNNISSAIEQGIMPNLSDLDILGVTDSWKQVADKYADSIAEGAQNVDTNNVNESGKTAGSNITNSFVSGVERAEAHDTNIETTGKDKGQKQLDAHANGIERAEAHDRRINNSGSTSSSSSAPLPPGVLKAEQHDSKITVNADAQTDNAEQKLTEFEEKVLELKTLTEEGVTFSIEVSGVKDITKAATAAKTITANTGDKNFSVTANTGTSKQDVEDLKTSISGLSDKTVSVTANVSGLSAAQDLNAAVQKFANFKSSYTINLHVNGSGKLPSGLYTGQNNKIFYTHAPVAGSAATGTKKGRIGPRGQGGLTLTGELGYEIAWLPNENRSIILGAKGPQMINLPNNAIVYNHEQSKDIMKKRSNTIAGSMHGGSYTPSRNNWNFSSSSSRSSSRSSSPGSSGSSSSSSSSNTTINHFSIEEVVRFNLDKKIEAMTSKIKKLTEEIDKNLKKIGTTALDITDSTQEQIKNLKSIKAFNDSLIASYQKDIDTIDKNKYMMQVSYTDDNGDKQDYTFDAQWYMYQTDGMPFLNDSAIRQLGSPGLEKAVTDAMKGLIDPLISGLQKARDAADDAQKQIEDLAEKFADTFYGWKNELTEIYDLTQRIENETSFTDRFASQIELELSKLGTGFGETEKAISNISAVLNRNNQTLKNQIENTHQLINARKRELDNALSTQDELEKIDAYKNSEAYTKASDEERNAVIRKLTDEYDVAANALAYIKNVNRELDGSVTYDIDWEGFEEANRQNPLNEETYKAIKEYLDSLNDATTEYNGSIKDTTDLLKQTYDDLKKYQDTIVDFEGALLKGVEEQIKNDTENAKKLSDSISNALKDLLDEVKRKLDERRRQEDNAKTERDIAQKQQRLAALRANTSGGNQVEIAQLEKEIADAQQSYGRTLEDQLLDKLQQQGDEAKLQRERQIELAEASNEINAANNKELVNLWLKDPQKYKEEIKAAWLEAQGYDEKGFAEQDALLNQWDTEWTNLLTAIEQTGFNESTENIEKNTYTLVKLLADATGAVVDVTERNTETLKDLTKDVEGAKKAYSKGVDAKTLKDKFGFDAKTLAGGGYTPSDLKRAGFGVGDLVSAGITDVKTLKDAGFNDATAIKTALGETNAKGISDYKSAGFTAKDLKGLFDDAELIELFDAKALKDAQFKASELKGKFNISQLKDAGYTLPQLKDAFGASEFGAGGISYADARAAGFTAQQLKNVAQYAKQAAAELQPKVSQGRDLAYGSQGSDVKLLQQTLNKLGIRDNSGNSLDVDGDFGQHTREAVINFQKKYRNKASKTLSADGVVGYYTKEAFKALGYKTGGLADYTGPAWLDGTPSKPELVLNATDTKNFLALRDVLSSVMKSTSSVANAYGGNATYEININVDKLTSDYDVDRVAERVKKIIVKDSSYRNVTQVRNFR